MSGAGGVRAGQAYVELGVKNKMKGSLNRIGKQLKRFALGAAKIVGIASAAMVAFGAATLKAFAAFGDSIHKMSARTGVGAKALTELKFAAEQSGASINDVEKAIKRMSVALLDAGRGSKDAVDSLAAIGLSAAKLKGLSPEQQFNAIMRGLQGVASASERAALAQKLFGRAGTTLLPMIGNMKQLRTDAQRLGLTMSKEGVQAAADVTDAVNTIKSAWKGMFMTVLDQNAKFLTAMAKMTEVFARNIQRIMGASSSRIGMGLLKRAAAFGKIFGFTAPGLDNAINGASSGMKAMGTGDLSKVFGELAGALNPMGGNGAGGNGDGEGIKPDPRGAPGTTVPTYWDVMGHRIGEFSKGIPGEVTGGVTSAMSSVGSFVGGSGVGQGVSRVVEVGEKQLDEQKKTNEKLDEMKRMADMNNGGGTTFINGI